jgi:predicted nucleic acid-binding protein
VKELVLDSSATLGFLLDDERCPEVVSVLEALAAGVPTRVPGLWWWETANALVMAERRRRIAPAVTETTLLAFHMLPVITDDKPESVSLSDTFSLAREHGLTVYDAAYLELAVRHRSALATLDQVLARAAVSVGVELLV